MHWGYCWLSIAADEIDGYAIPAKSIVLINIDGLHHHHHRYWADPMRFDPDRFAPEGAQARRVSTLFVGVAQVHR